MARPEGYEMAAFGLMIECEPRMAIYAEALKRAITPGCHVIDIGAGFGIFSILACKYGAGSVVAIEPDPASELIMTMAQANGCADKITVVRDISTRYTPDRKADVIVSDIRGIVPLFQHHIATITDARERLLAPDGQLIPMRDTIMAAPVYAPVQYAPCDRPWTANNYGLDLSAGRQFAVNCTTGALLQPEALIAQSQVFAELDYRTRTDPNADAELEFVADKASTINGILLWFEAEIAEGLKFSTEPGAPELVYRQMLLPLEEAVQVKAGDRISAKIKARLIDGNYIWSWNTTIWQAGTSEKRYESRQSSFKGRIFSPDALRHNAHNHAPELTPALAVDRDCLSLVGDGRSHQDIADALFEKHEDHFADAKAALDHVTKLLDRYGSARG